MCQNLKAISTSNGNVYGDTIVGDSIDLKLHFINFDVLFFCDYNAFYENDTGDVFYDFNLKFWESTSPSVTAKSFDSIEICKIKVFSREIGISDFKKYSEAHKFLGSFQKTTDLFLLYFKNNTQILITFHPFLTGLEAYFTAQSISIFWDEYAQLYKLEHTIV